MSDYDNTNRGALFKNDKQGVENRPDYTGTLDVAGAAHKVAGWVKKSKKGDTYLSLAIQPSEDAPKPKKAERQEEPDDALPF